MSNPPTDERLMQVTLTRDELWRLLIYTTAPSVLEWRISEAMRWAIYCGVECPGEPVMRELGWTPPEGWVSDSEECEGAGAACHGTAPV